MGSVHLAMSRAQAAFARAANSLAGSSLRLQVSAAQVCGEALFARSPRARLANQTSGREVHPAPYQGRRPASFKRCTVPPARDANSMFFRISIAPASIFSSGERQQGLAALVQLLIEGGEHHRGERVVRHERGDVDDRGLPEDSHQLRVGLWADLSVAKELAAEGDDRDRKSTR